MSGLATTRPRTHQRVCTLHQEVGFKIGCPFGQTNSEKFHFERCAKKALSLISRFTGITSSRGSGQVPSSHRIIAAQRVTIFSNGSCNRLPSCSDEPSSCISRKCIPARLQRGHTTPIAAESMDRPTRSESNDLSPSSGSIVGSAHGQWKT
jgi:hypothetical protein